MYISHSSKIPGQLRDELKWEEEYSKTCHKRPLKKKTKNWFQDRLLLNAGQKYCRMLQWEHSAILSTFIKLPFANKTFVLSIFEWPLKTGFSVNNLQQKNPIFSSILHVLRLSLSELFGSGAQKKDRLRPNLTITNRLHAGKGQDH